MATIQNVGIGPMDPGFSVIGGKQPNQKENASDAFASLMNMGGVKTDDVTDLASKTDPTKELVPASDSAKAEDQGGASKYENAGSISQNSVASKLRDKVNSSADTASSDASSEADRDALVFDLRALVKGELDLEDDQLDELLAEAGLTIEMLLDPAVMKQFILETNGVSEVDLLVNENLAGITEDLLSGLQNLTENYDIKNVSAMIESLAAGQEDEITEFVPEVADDSLDGALYKTDAAPENAAPENAQPSETLIKTETTAPTETGGSGFSDAKDHGRSETGADHIVANLHQAVSEAVSADPVNAATTVSEVSQADVITQVIDEIKATMSREVTTLELLLNPEQLGRVHIQVSSKNGIMQAQIVAETEAAKNAIEQGLAALKETFETHELKVDAIEVMIADYEFFNQEAEADLPEQGRRSGENRGSVSDDSMEEETLPEEEEDILMRTSGSSVSYTA